MGLGKRICDRSEPLNCQQIVRMEQVSFTLSPFQRGFHLITALVIKEVPQIRLYSQGILHLFICHTSASLTLNENADPTVRLDFETHFDRMVPENDALYKHSDEGSDDMPAHIKTALLDTSLMIPINGGRLATGTWQGIYLCEHRNDGGRRRFVATLWGDLIDQTS